MDTTLSPLGNLREAADRTVDPAMGKRAERAMEDTLTISGLVPSPDVCRAFALGLIAAEHYAEAPRKNRRKQRERWSVLATMAARRGHRA